MTKPIHTHYTFYLMLVLMTATACKHNSAKSTTQSKPMSQRRVSKAGCPIGDKAIVSLTYDDGLASQLSNAVPMLDERGIHATFFLNDIGANPAPWKAVRDAGHELASHTLAHPCTASFDWVKEGNASEDFTPKRMSKELDDQLALLQSLGASPPYSFAYPCGTTWIGSEHTSYIPLVEQRFVAARGVGGDIITQLDVPMNVPAYFLEGPLEAFIGSANAAIAKKGWVVFGFHGVGGDYLSVSNADHGAFLDWLVAHQNEVAVLPFRDAAQCMMP
ncbi:MAG: polysaccharide deacetylase family protein [Deltaproteobacteria bacterium]|nr:polysaccharide deacetylase family protein [Deltaproteobacteria bacterium]